MNMGHSCSGILMLSSPHRGAREAGMGVLQASEVLTCQGAASSQRRHAQRGTHRHACRYPAPGTASSFSTKFAVHLPNS